MRTQNEYEDKHPLQTCEDEFSTHPVTQHDQEMGPWGSSILPAHSLQFLPVVPDQNMHRLSNLKKLSPRYKSILAIRSTIKEPYKNSNSTRSNMLQKNANIQLRKLSQLPVISARQSCEFMETQKQNQEQDTTCKFRSKSNIIQDIQEGWRKMTESDIETRKPVCKRRTKNCSNPAILPSLKIYLPNRNKCYNIYQSCLVKTKKKYKSTSQ